MKRDNAIERAYRGHIGVTQFILDCIKCKYPNIAAEINKHNAGHPITYAAHANITYEILKQFLNGEEDLTLSEFQGIINLSRSMTNVSYHFNYLACKKLTYYDLSKPKHYRKVLIIYNKVQKAITQCRTQFDRERAENIMSLDQIKKNGYITRAHINYALRVIEGIERSNQIYGVKPRGYKIS